MDDLESARAKRWGYSARKIASFDRACAWIDDVGFALLWPRARSAVPVLWAVGSDDGEVEWGPDAERMWGWKDEIPRRKRAWYGHFLFGRKSFLSLELLNHLYPRTGRADDFRDAGLSKNARQIAEVILSSGPVSAATLREATDLRGHEYSKAAVELGRALVVTHYGIEDQGAGWPSAVLELTARAFKLKPSNDRTKAARAFLGTVLRAKPNELARAFNWATTDARRSLEDLRRSGDAERDASTYRASATARR